jgi:general nucleoside transport system ATP-binding protein
MASRTKNNGLEWSDSLMATVLEAKGISKHFPGVLANDQVNFDLRQGEIHALLGENGAGKTTLMNVLYGLYRPDKGGIFINDKAVSFESPKDAIAQGIGMVHQHFMLIPVFTVAENIMLGSETVKGLTLDEKSVAREVQELSHQYSLDVNPFALVHELPVGVQQRVEIVKALYRKAEILILDEPTAVLTPQEADDLFIIMRKLTSQGVSIIFITHKLKEVLAISDRITVMRAGHVVGTTTPADTSETQLASMMVGREVILTVDKSPAKPGDQVFSVKDLCVQDNRGIEVVHKVTFEVHQGETLGIAGVQGNGQTELVEAITGLRPVHSGNVFLSNHDMTGAKSRILVENGQGHIPEDRQRHGLVLPFPIVDNLVLCTYYRSPFAKYGVIQAPALDANARGLISRFDIRAPSAFVNTSTLSGGNQQKVIVARELSREIKFLVANQPTRGLDVGSIEYIHRQIVDMRDQGIGVLLVSAELDEIIALSDRIAVMYRGQLVAILPAEEVTREQLGLLMAGAVPQ